MNLTRLNLLFGSEKDKATSIRLRCILAACCTEARYRARVEACRRGPASLTNGERVYFSIDDVMRHLPTDFGSPAAPSYKPKYKVWEVIDALENLKALSFLDDPEDCFEEISLTDDLFKAIAEEWAYARGARPHRIGDDKIFAQTVTHAHWISAIRQKNRKEVSHA